MFTNPYYLIPIVIATVVWLFFTLKSIPKSSGDNLGFDVLWSLVMKVFFLVPYLLFWVILLGIRSCNAN